MNFDWEPKWTELAALIVGQEPVKQDALVHRRSEGLQRILDRAKIFFNIIFYTVGERVDSVSFEISVADSDGNSHFTSNGKLNTVFINGFLCISFDFTHLTLRSPSHSCRYISPISGRYAREDWDRVFGICMPIIQSRFGSMIMKDFWFLLAIMRLTFVKLVVLLSGFAEVRCYRRVDTRNAMVYMRQ